MDRVTVLCVDDDPDLVEMTAVLLEAADEQFETITETDPCAALDRLEADPIDCVVSDYEMPGMDGIDLLVAVRDRHPDLPFVLFTGTGSEDVASTAAAHGATDCLSKGAGSEQYALLADRLTEDVRKQGIHSTVSTPS